MAVARGDRAFSGWLNDGNFGIKLNMDKSKYSVLFWAYDFEVLQENRMISSICSSQLAAATAKRVDDEDVVELALTMYELEELTGYVAAEANHAKSRRVANDLNEICDYLEGRLYELKRADSAR